MLLNNYRNKIKAQHDVTFTRNIAEFDRMKGVLVSIRILLRIIAEIFNDINVTLYCLNDVFPSYIDMERIEFIMLQTNPYDALFAHSYSKNVNITNNIEIVDFKYNRDTPNTYKIIPLFQLKIQLRITGQMDVIYTENSKYCNLSTTNVTLNNLTHPKLPSRNYVDNVMQQLLGIDPNNDYIGHIDFWSKFLSDDKIVIKQFNETDTINQKMEMIVGFVVCMRKMMKHKQIQESFVHNENATKVCRTALLNHEIIGFYSANETTITGQFSVDFDYILNRIYDLCI